MVYSWSEARRTWQGDPLLELSPEKINLQRHRDAHGGKPIYQVTCARALEVEVDPLMVGEPYQGSWANIISEGEEDPIDYTTHLHFDNSDEEHNINLGLVEVLEKTKSS